MKITELELRHIIKEELQNYLMEQDPFAAMDKEFEDYDDPSWGEPNKGLTQAQIDAKRAAAAKKPAAPAKPAQPAKPAAAAPKQPAQPKAAPAAPAAPKAAPAPAAGTATQTGQAKIGPDAQVTYKMQGKNVVATISQGGKTATGTAKFRGNVGNAKASAKAAAEATLARMQ